MASNMLASSRALLAQQLVSAGVTVSDHVPERINPPLAVIEPGTPYVQAGQTFTEFEVRYQVILLAATAANQVASSELDRLIVAVLDAVDTFDLDQVDQPSQFDTGSAQFLGTRLTFSTHSEL